MLHKHLFAHEVCTHCILRLLAIRGRREKGGAGWGGVRVVSSNVSSGSGGEPIGAYVCGQVMDERGEELGPAHPYVALR
jgi:hypothetical protein